MPYVYCTPWETNSGFNRRLWWQCSATTCQIGYRLLWLLFFFFISLSSCFSFTCLKLYRNIRFLVIIICFWPVYINYMIRQNNIKIWQINISHRYVDEHRKLSIVRTVFFLNLITFICTSRILIDSDWQVLKTTWPSLDHCYSEDKRNSLYGTYYHLLDNLLMVYKLHFIFKMKLHKPVK